jgi:hypothetical protein
MGKWSQIIVYNNGIQAEEKTAQHRRYLSEENDTDCYIATLDDVRKKGRI